MTTQSASSDFPIPPGVEGFWAGENGHFPRPATPLIQEIIYKAMTEGFSGAMKQWVSPFGVECRAINYYGFLTLKPFDLGAEPIEDRIARYKETLEEALPRMGEMWEQQWLPPILPALEKGRAADYTGLSEEELLNVLEEMFKDLLQRWTIHGWVNYSTIPASWFADFYNETFEPEDSTEPYLLLLGSPLAL